MARPVSRTIKDRIARGNPGGVSITPLVPQPPEVDLDEMVIPRKVLRDVRALSHWRHFEKYVAKGHFVALDAQLLGELAMSCARLDRFEEEWDAMGSPTTQENPKTEMEVVHPMLVNIRAEVDTMRKLMTELCITVSARNRVTPGSGPRGQKIKNADSPAALLDG